MGTKEVEEGEKEKQKKVVVEAGSGVALGDIDYVHYILERHRADDLKLFHRALFGKHAPAVDIKRNIRKFSGFTFTTDSKEHEKKVDMLSRMFLPPLKEMMGWVGLQVTGTKENLIQKFIEFLYEPKDLEKKV